MANKNYRRFSNHTLVETLVDNIKMPGDVYVTIFSRDEAHIVKIVKNDFLAMLEDTGLEPHMFSGFSFTRLEDGSMVIDKTI